jgi:hypothetical protein
MIVAERYGAVRARATYRPGAGTRTEERLEEEWGSG